jgi:hypothetical protein
MSPDLSISTLLGWGISAILVPLWLHTAVAISRNGRDVAELRGRVKAIEQFHGELSVEIRSLHQRTGGIAQTTNEIKGQVSALTNIMTPIFEHLLQREKQ